jgi:hypothetical protein
MRVDPRLLALVLALVLVLVLVLAFATPATAATDLAQPDNEAISYHGISFPKIIGGGRRISARDKEATGSGAGFEAVYVHGAATTTIHIYNLNKFKIPDNVRGPVLMREFNSLKHSVLTTRAVGQDVSRGREFSVADVRDVPRMVCAPYVMAQGHMSVPDDRVIFRSDYIICLGVVNGEFLQTSTRISHLPDSVTVVRRFLDALAGQFWK